MMNKTSLCLAAFSCMLAFFPSLVTQQDEYDFTVHGRIVDEFGRPVKGGTVTLNDPPWSDVGYKTKSSGDGRFKLNNYFAPSSPNRVLYVTGPEPQGAVLLISPPFGLTPSRFPLRHIGREIVSRKNTSLDVGDIKVQLRYGPAIIYLRDSRGKPLFTKKSEWRSVWLRLRDKNGAIVSETSISKEDLEKSVEELTSAITVALPEGVWQLDLSLSAGKEPWLSCDKPVTIKAEGPVPDLYVVSLR